MFGQNISDASTDMSDILPQMCSHLQVSVFMLTVVIDHLSNEQNTTLDFTGKV